MKKKWFLDLDFRWQEMCFYDKNCVKWRNPCYFLYKKSVKPGTMLIETVLSGDSLYQFKFWKHTTELSLPVWFFTWYQTPMHFLVSLLISVFKQKIHDPMVTSIFFQVIIKHFWSYMPGLGVGYNFYNTLFVNICA